MIPYLMGFQPVESLVLIALEGPRKRFGPMLRIDLVDDPELVEEQTRLLCRVVTDHKVERVLVAAFSVEARQAHPSVSRLLAELAALDVEVEDAFRADGARLWSYVCDNPQCCSPSGVPYDVTASAAAAEAVLAGMAFEADRDSLRAWVGPGDDLWRQEVASALAGLGSGADGADPVDAGQLLGRIARLLDDPLAGAAPDIAWLARAVQPIAGRDAAIGAIDRAEAGRHFELWRQVLRSVHDDLLPSVGCIAAFAAWLDGRGVMASHVLERVFPVDPHNSFADLLANLLTAAVDPRNWDLVACTAGDAADLPPPVG